MQVSCPKCLKYFVVGMPFAAPPSAPPPSAPVVPPPPPVVQRKINPPPTPPTKAAIQTSAPRSAPAVRVSPRPAASTPKQGASAGKVVLAIFLVAIIGGVFALGLYLGSNPSGSGEKVAQSKDPGNSDGPALENKKPETKNSTPDAEPKKTNAKTNGPDTTKPVPVVETKQPPLENKKPAVESKKSPEDPPTVPVNVDPPAKVEPPRSANIPGVDKKMIDEAIDRGIVFLRKSHGDLVGMPEFQMGYIALAGLALVETYNPKLDPKKDAYIQKLAGLVRVMAPENQRTYDNSVAILFLDRLGDKQDEPLIKLMGLRLIASQDLNGGWGYPTRTLRDIEAGVFLDYLLRNRLPNKGGPKDLKPKMLVTVNMLSDSLRASPSVAINVTPENRHDFHFKEERSVYTDNSNTQFALLGLWAARRHGIPSERALLLGSARFISDKDNPGGGWAYRICQGTTQDAMTCVGLIALALGHGAAGATLEANPDFKKPKTNLLADPHIERGFRALHPFIGSPKVDLDSARTENYYFLWCVERVAMLYNVQKIGGKDWYAWGAQSFIKSQEEDGSWHGQHYRGVSKISDTCFALFFLRRSNLVQDLTEKLELFQAIEN